MCHLTQTLYDASPVRRHGWFGLNELSQLCDQKKTAGLGEFWGRTLQFLHQGEMTAPWVAGPLIVPSACPRILFSKSAQTYCCLRSACGSQIERNNNFSSCEIRWRFFQVFWNKSRTNSFRDWETHWFSAVTRPRMWLVKTQWTIQEYFQCSLFS